MTLVPCRDAVTTGSMSHLIRSQKWHEFLIDENNYTTSAIDPGLANRVTPCSFVFRASLVRFPGEGPELDIYQEQEKHLQCSKRCSNKRNEYAPE